jgi:hypothetical protein
MSGRQRLLTSSSYGVAGKSMVDPKYTSPTDSVCDLTKARKQIESAMMMMYDEYDACRRYKVYIFTFVSVCTSLAVLVGYIQEEEDPLNYSMQNSNRCVRALH